MDLSRNSRSRMRQFRSLGLLILSIIQLSYKHPISAPMLMAVKLSTCLISHTCISYLYRGGPAPEPLEADDADGNGTVNLLDITYLINYINRAGPEPVCP